MIKNSETAIVAVVTVIVSAIALSILSYWWSISQIKDPLVMCFARANGSIEMGVCLELEEALKK